MVYVQSEDCANPSSLPAVLDRTSGDLTLSDITEKARKDAEREYNERMSGLKADVTDIAFDISKKILSREVTDADNMAIADEFFSKYGEKEEKV